jgi:hypothetical protein
MVSGGGVRASGFRSRIRSGDSGGIGGNCFSRIIIGPGGGGVGGCK